MREGEGGEWWGFERANWANRARATGGGDASRVVGGLTSAWRLSWAHPRLRPRGSRRAERCPAVSDGAGHLEYLEHVRGVALRLRRRLLRGEGAAPRGFVVHVDVVVVVARLGILVNLASGRGGGGDGELRRRGGTVVTARSRERGGGERAFATGVEGDDAPQAVPRRARPTSACDVDGPNRPTPARSEANASARTTDARRLDANSRLRRMCSRTRAAPRASPCAPAESAPRPRATCSLRTNWSSAATSGKKETASACPRTERRRRARIRARAWTSYLRACVS